jgi:hypothetical protein
MIKPFAGVLLKNICHKYQIVSFYTVERFSEQQNIKIADTYQDLFKQ